MKLKNKKELPDFIKNIVRPMIEQKEDELPVSAFKDSTNGDFEPGTTKYEKKRNCS